MGSPISFVPEDQQASIGARLSKILGGAFDSTPEAGIPIAGFFDSYPGAREALHKYNPDQAALAEQLYKQAEPYRVAYAQLAQERPDVIRSPHPEVQALLTNPQSIYHYGYAAQLHDQLSNPREAYVEPGTEYQLPYGW